MEIAFVQVDDDVRLQRGRDRKKWRAQRHSHHIDAFALATIWPFVSYLRRQIVVTKEAVSMHIPRQFNVLFSVLHSLWNEVKKTKRNETKQKETLQTEGFARRWFSSSFFSTLSLLF